MSYLCLMMQQRLFITSSSPKKMVQFIVMYTGLAMVQSELLVQSGICVKPECKAP